RRVVLPQPDAPTTVMNSPAPTRKLALSRARTRSPEALLNVFETAASSIAGVSARCCDGVNIAWPSPSRWLVRGAALEEVQAKSMVPPQRSWQGLPRTRKPAVIGRSARDLART